MMFSVLFVSATHWCCNCRSVCVWKRERGGLLVFSVLSGHRPRCRRRPLACHTYQCMCTNCEVETQIYSFSALREITLRSRCCGGTIWNCIVYFLYIYLFLAHMWSRIVSHKHRDIRVRKRVSYFPFETRQGHQTTLEEPQDSSAYPTPHRKARTSQFQAKASFLSPPGPDPTAQIHTSVRPRTERKLSMKATWYSLHFYAPD